MNHEVIFVYCKNRKRLFSLDKPSSDTIMIKLIYCGKKVRLLVFFTINIHLMYSPEVPNVSLASTSSRDEVEGNIRARGKTKLTSFPRDSILSALIYIWTFP